MRRMAAPQILFVDDDPALRLTLPVILRGHGYSVTTAATVSEALSSIGSHSFGVLISDLNIGHPGDGFAVVSAMRRTQPRCINFILTGYPAFEAALQAIRSHVDHYLIKPAHVEELVATIQAKLADPEADNPLPLKQVSAILREHASQITATVLEKMKREIEFTRLSISDEERIDHIPELLASLCEQLDSREPDDISLQVTQAAFRHGTVRYQQSYGIAMIIDEVRLLDKSIYETIQDHLLSLDLSNLVPDLSRVNQMLETALKESVRSYLAQEQKAA
jgi:ActR/RegA family two-component response regulator